MSNETMRGFASLLNYRLLKGSHEFPGPDGGACLNEVAVVAAGLDYRAIAQASDCPPCFSRPIAAYVIRLNDSMPDEVRQHLKRFALRLAGTSDTPAIEMQRARFLAVETVRRILPLLLLDWDAIKRCQAVAPFDLTSAQDAAVLAVRSVAALEAYGARFNAVQTVASALLGIEVARERPSISRAMQVARRAGDAVVYANFCTVCEDAPPIWPHAIALLDEVLAIGRQAPAPEADVALARLAAVFGTPRATDAVRHPAEVL